MTWYEGTQLFVVTTIFSIITLQRRRGRGRTFTPFNGNEDLSPSTLVVDCRHPTAVQLTHHLKGKQQKKSMPLGLRGDTSTDACINAIIAYHPVLNGIRYVTSNHFDVDSFISVWCILYPDLARVHDKTLREVARIGDFRELRLDEPWQRTALKLVCWLNSEERKLFYRPYESAIAAEMGEEKGVQKFQYFLPLFSRVLEDVRSFFDQWTHEYTRVTNDYDAVASSSNTGAVHANLGLVVVRVKDPLHYYALFSSSRGYDIVLSIYQGNRYEVETKYTTYVDISSRKVLPRVDMTPLAGYLNKLEAQKRSEQATSADIPVVAATNATTGSTESPPESPPHTDRTGPGPTIAGDQYQWHCDRITDSGPILRLEHPTRNLQKAERYGHPYERPIHPSLIHPDLMESILVAYLQYAYRGVEARVDWEWDELHAFNEGIQWSAHEWNPPIREE
jgi:hypothetical protein